eukprot:5709426-Pleurochrysis_carterae.AAC.5
MMREAKNRAEGQQAGARRKAIRAPKAGVNLFTALEPSLGSDPIFHLRQQLFGPNALKDSGEALITGCIRNNQAFRRSNQRSPTLVQWQGPPLCPILTRDSANYYLHSDLKALGQ